MTPATQKVNEFRARFNLPPLKHLPRDLGNFCEHCISELSDFDLDHEWCSTCARRVNVRMSDEEWTRKVRGKP